MGLIKAAILIGGGAYAIKKITESREGHHCGCNHNRSRDINVPQDVNAPQGSWTPGTKVKQFPEYRDEKSLPYQPGEAEKDGWVTNEKELGGLRGTNGA